jgi:hypothetical protein
LLLLLSWMLRQTAVDAVAVVAVVVVVIDV